MRRLAAAALVLFLAGCAEEPLKTRVIGQYTIREHSGKVEVSRAVQGQLPSGEKEKCVDTFVDLIPYKSLDDFRWECEKSGSGSSFSGESRAAYEKVLKKLYANGYTFPEERGD